MRSTQIRSYLTRLFGRLRINWSHVRTHLHKLLLGLGNVWTRVRKHLRNLFGRVRIKWSDIRKPIDNTLFLAAALSILTFGFLFNRIFINVYPGETAVIWRRFAGGTDMENIYTEGLHIVAPWNRMYVYNTRIQVKDLDFDALSKAGLPIRFELSVRYRPIRSQLPFLHREVGPNYLEVIVRPEILAVIRGIVANYTVQEIYTSEGYILYTILHTSLGRIADRHVELDDLLIRRLVLPPELRASIERKLVEEQRMLAYDYRLQREAKEADRKRIEAAGIRDFQREVVGTGAFDKYLDFFGIQTTLELASSPNSKVVVIGRTENGLPLILNMADVPRPEASLSDKSQSVPTPDTPGSLPDHDITEYSRSGLSPETRELLQDMGTEDTETAPRPPYTIRPHTVPQRTPDVNEIPVPQAAPATGTPKDTQ